MTKQGSAYGTVRLWGFGSSCAWGRTNQGPGAGASVYISRSPLALGVHFPFLPKTVSLAAAETLKSCWSREEQSSRGQSRLVENRADQGGLEEASTGQSRPARSTAGWRERGLPPGHLAPGPPPAQLFSQRCRITIELFVTESFPSSPHPSLGISIGIEQHQ